MACMNAMVAGIMIVLCVYELIPTALKYTNPKVCVLCGMRVIIVECHNLCDYRTDCYVCFSVFANRSKVLFHFITRSLEHIKSDSCKVIFYYLYVCY